MNHAGWKLRHAQARIALEQIHGIGESPLRPRKGLRHGANEGVCSAVLRAIDVQRNSWREVTLMGAAELEEAIAGKGDVEGRLSRETQEESQHQCRAYIRRLV